jgi:molybdopterin biosynthesis enzyme MoaB
VIHKEASSLTNMILIESLKITKFAALSRATAGVRNNKTLIVNLPGSKKGSQVNIFDEKYCLNPKKIEKY